LDRRCYLPLCGDAEDVIDVAVAEHRGNEAPINRHSIRNVDVLVVHNRVCRLVVASIDDGVLFKGEGDGLCEEGRDSDPLWLEGSVQLVKLGRRNRARDLIFRIGGFGFSIQDLIFRIGGLGFSIQDLIFRIGGLGSGLQKLFRWSDDGK
jgi:hypothetical protein